MAHPLTPQARPVSELPQKALEYSEGPTPYHLHSGD